MLSIWCKEGLKSMDLTMMELQNARERESDGWARASVEVNHRLKFVKGEKPAGASLWILKAV